jgi:hypothetical protein
MFSKRLSKSAVSIFGFVFVMSLCIGLPVAVAEVDPEPCKGQSDCCIYGCPDDCEFTQDFNLRSCRGFRTIGKNPYFILIPGYQLILEGVEDESEPDETLVREEVTVLCETKWIKLGHRWIRTRVVEERALEWEEGEDGEEGEWVVIEISLNWFAICNRTNDVYYFGEDSRECENGFTEDEQMCEPEEEGEQPTEPDDEGSWEAGVDGAMPGLIMPGTALIGAKYFQEIAEEQEAVDRGQIVDVGIEEPEDWSGLEIKDWLDCIEIHDTNPTEAEEGGCIGENDVKLYCRQVGLVADQELQLIERGFVGCGHDGDDDDDDDDDHHGKRGWIVPDGLKRWF